MKTKKFLFLSILISGIALFAAPVSTAQEYDVENVQEDTQQPSVQENEEYITDLDVENPEVKSTDEQQNQLHTCLKLADELLSAARAMREASFQPDVKIEDLSKQFEQLKEHLQMLKDQNELFVQILDDEQKAKLKSSLDTTSEAHKILKIHLEDLGKEFKKIEPDREQIFHHCEEIEKTSEEWVLAYREISRAMNLEPTYEE